MYSASLLYILLVWLMMPGQSEQACDTECVTCTGSTCTTCEDGFYVDGSDTLCTKCQNNGCTCTDTNTCTGCIPGYYYSGATLTCIKCYNNGCTCNNDYFRCNSCVPGYYKNGTHCAYCSEGCKSCSSCTNCNTCQDGYYNMSTNGPCQQCMDNCKTCGTANTCTECYPGYTYTEDTCQQDCPVNCKNNVCSVNSGRCSTCETGFYGDYCSETCSSGCKTTHGTAVCNIADGSCTDGCQLSTKYGPQCSKECSILCVNQECDRVTAHCLNGCQPGYHGENCTFACSEGCINGSCHGSNGSCISGCKQGLTSGQCTAGSSLSPEQSVDGVVIGGAVGGVVAGVLIIAGVVVGVCLLRRRRGTGRDEARNCGAAFDNSNGPSYGNQTMAADSTSRVVTEHEAQYVNLEIEPFRGGAIDENAAAAENVYDELMEDITTADGPYPIACSRVLRCSLRTDNTK